LIDALLQSGLNKSGLLNTPIQNVIRAQPWSFSPSLENTPVNIESSSTHCCADVEIVFINVKTRRVNLIILSKTLHICVLL